MLAGGCVEWCRLAVRKRPNIGVLFLGGKQLERRAVFCVLTRGLLNPLVCESTGGRVEWRREEGTRSRQRSGIARCAGARMTGRALGASEHGGTGRVRATWVSCTKRRRVLSSRGRVLLRLRTDLFCVLSSTFCDVDMREWMCDAGIRVSPMRAESQVVVGGRAAGVS